MLIIQIIGIILMLFGIVCIFYSLSVFTKNKIKEEDDYLERSILSSIGNKTEEIDKTIDEFDKASGEVFTQLDKKYNELLFMYSLIEDKRAETANAQSKEPQASVQPASAPVKPTPKNASKALKLKNPKYEEIESLKNQGLSPADIAKKLGIGQGEVHLVLELNKIDNY